MGSIMIELTPESVKHLSDEDLRKLAELISEEVKRRGTRTPKPKA
ncbi:MAG TPA: hypothetical protein VKR60_06285 [Candidatus Sulfotelmatobacter sp.]|nr:hypothetical protein [Candidatus Sulfotelmatobacter sp.]